MSRGQRTTALGPWIYALALLACWPILVKLYGSWGLFAELWPMTVTMIVGSFIAGATSEGGGAVAFPVMTLLFGIAPATARDFSLMIQSFGMSSATVTIWRNRIPVLWTLSAGVAWEESPGCGSGSPTWGICSLPTT